MILDLTEAQLRRIVDGAVLDALKTHPDYLTDRGQRMALNGIAKRVTGALKGFAAQAAEGRASHPAATTEGEALTLSVTS